MSATIVSRQGGRRYPQVRSANGFITYAPVGPTGREIAIRPGPGVIPFTETGALVQVTLSGAVVDLGSIDSFTQWIWQIDGAVVGTSQNLTTFLTPGPHSVLLTAQDSSIPPNSAVASMLISVGLSVPFRLDRIPGR